MLLSSRNSVIIILVELMDVGIIVLLSARMVFLSLSSGRQRGLIALLGVLRPLLDVIGGVLCTGARGGLLQIREVFKTN